MASLTKDNRIQFKADDGKRQTIRLGKMPRKQAQGIHRHVERLIACRIDGSAPPEETSRWITGVSDKLREKLVKTDLLLAKVSAKAYTLGDLIDDFKARPKWKAYKPSTRLSSQRAYEKIIDRFGADQLVRQVRPSDAVDFYDELLLSEKDGGKGLGVASCHLMASIAFSLFNFAIDIEAIDRNPFKVLPRTSCKGNNASVSLVDSLAVLDAMEGTQGRLLFALSRWGGLRVSSEPLRLRWSDIDWENNRFLVHSPKTERHTGHETRWVPIFDELAPLFNARFTEATEGEELVLPILRGMQGNATTMLKKAIKIADLELWPRLWHSMRSTRQTELEVATGNRDIVCAWLGNSPETARKHYINFTEQHFEEAIQKVTQKATQHTSAQPRMTAHSQNA